MFKNLKTPMDYVKSMTDIMMSMPKTYDETKTMFEKIQLVLKAEFENTQDMWKVYKKVSTGDATVNEINSANKKATEVLKTTMFASILAIPGSLFILPALVAQAKEYDVDLVPKSVSSQFAI